MDQRVLSEVRHLVDSQCGQFDFDPSELAIVGRDDLFVNMFVEDNKGDTKKTAEAILKALAYRKKYQLYNLSVNELPIELFGWNVKTGHDVNGKKILWVNCGCHRKIPELVDTMLKATYFFSSNINSSYEKYDTYADLRGLSYKTVDMRYSRKLSSMMTSCFPGMADQLFICGLPFTLKAVVKAMFNMVPARYLDKISFLDIDEAKGRIAQLKHFEPPGGTTIKTVLRRESMPEVEVEKIMETFNGARRMSAGMFDDLGI
ncbi:hypothetical protein HDE_13293 [Halotydeus destructor]|nr:hypothetical protein HDE_13293 [Halotydeus destructor]